MQTASAPMLTSTRLSRCSVISPRSSQNNCARLVSVCQHKVPPDVWAAKVDGRASFFLFGHGGATIDPYDTFMLYYSEPPAMGEQSWGNITRWQNADFKAIADEMNNTAMDDPKMKDLFRRGMEIYYKELPDCPAGAVVPPHPGQHLVLGQLAG